MTMDKNNHSNSEVMDELYPDYKKCLKEPEVEIFLQFTSRGNSPAVVAASIVYTRKLCSDGDGPTQAEVCDEFGIGPRAVYPIYHEIYEKHRDYFTGL